MPREWWYRHAADISGQFSSAVPGTETAFEILAVL